MPPETPAFLDPRLTERRNPRSHDLDACSSLELVDLINAEDATVAAAVARAREELARVIDLTEKAFRAGGRLLYLGAGTSGRLGVLDAAECVPTFSVPPGMVIGIIAGGAPALLRPVEGAEDDVNAGIAILDGHQVGPNDVVIGIAASGTTPFVRGALGRAQALGAKSVFLSCSEPPQLLRDTCDVCITLLTGPEVLTGSTRMKAGTATKLALNIISTGAMVRIGKTWGNLMVDLTATNSKLVDRSQRILMEATGVDRAQAKAALEASGGSVKVAIVSLRRGLPREEAEKLLAAHGGSLRSIVGAPPEVTG
ncbi:MAG: N-acetylmuramic acid 6-phosphate etherase [Gemmatimonadales bacterium]